MNDPDALHSTKALLDAVTKAQRLYFRDANPAELFESLLADLLALTESEYGYIAEVLHDDEVPYLKTWAITDISWDPDTRALIERNQGPWGEGLEFRNLDTLFGWGIRDGGRLVLTNEPAADPHSAGVPTGHPPLDSYLGIPIVRGDELYGQLGVANRPGGYEEALVDRLQPFITSVGHLIDAYRTDRDRRQAEAARYAIERRHGAIVDHLSDVITILDPDGSWLWSSPGGTRLLGYPPGHDPDGGIMSLLHPDDVLLATMALEQVLEGARSAHDPVDLRVRALDGSYRILETFGADLRDDPAVGGVLLTSRDVTARRGAEVALTERTAELSALVDNLSDAVLFVDADRRVLFVNQSFCDAMVPGSTPEELIGRHTPQMLDLARTLVAEEDFASAIEEIYATGEPRYGDRVTLQDGRVFERDHLPVHSQLGAAHLWIYRDMTDRVRMDEQRQRAMAQERTMRLAIEEQNKALREVDELKNDFVSTVSHELRTPLTSILSYSELLADESESMTEAQQGFLDVIRRNANRLDHLVDDLLLIGHVESGTLEIHTEPVVLRELVDGVVEALRDMAQSKDIRVVVDHDADTTPALLDPGRFDQVVMNLTSNAIKFTPSGGAVGIGTRRLDRSWILEVSDTGIGIPEAELTKLFDRFYRGTNARELQLPGSGLGLAITRAIVELHDGDVEIRSSDAGTTVTVTVPDITPATGAGQRRKAGIS